MTSEGGLADMIPSAWHIPFCKAAKIYGSLSLAIVMEAAADSELRHQMLHLYLLDDLISYRQYVDSWGIADWAAARKLCGLDTEDVAVLLSMTPKAVEMMELGWIVPDLGTLLEFASRMEWPLGILFRGESDWHPLTILWRQHRTGRGGAR